MQRLFQDKTTLAFGLIATVFIGLTVVGAVYQYSPVPFWDMWSGYLDFYVKLDEKGWAGWWAQHNEHRIVLARLFFWIDLAWFNGEVWFLLLVNYFLMALICSVFWLLWREQKYDSINYIIVFIFAWIFSWSQKENLTWGFQSQFILTQLFPLAAFYFLHRAALPSSENRNFPSAILCGILAIGSMANGVLVLPLMTLYAIVVRMGWQRCLLLAVLSVLCVSLYFKGYVAPAHHGSLVTALKDDPFGLVHYVLLYIGGPFYYILGGGNVLGGSIAKIVATISGAFLVISSAWIAWKTILRGKQATLALALIAFIIYIGGSALGTGGGRLIFGVDQALSSRYMTPALMAWASLLLLYLPRLDSLNKKIHGRLWMPFLLLLLLMIPCQLQALKSHQTDLFEKKVAALALELGVKDQLQVSRIFPSAELALSISEIPVEQNLSIFGMDPVKDARELIGLVSDKARGTGNRCFGYIDSVQAIPDEERYVFVQGWFFDPDQAVAPPSLLLSDTQGLVKGVALTGHSRPDVAKAIGTPAGFSGFKGYIRTESQGETVKLTAPYTGCQLSTTMPAVLFRTLTKFDESQVNLNTSHIHTNKGWTGSDYYRSHFATLTVYGSFINSDSDTGSLSIKIKRGDRLLYRSGPRSAHQIVEVVNSPHFSAVLPTAIDWVMLDFSSNLLPENPEVKFSDQGDSWGEWSAIAVKAD